MEAGPRGLCGVNVPRNVELATSTAREIVLTPDLRMEDAVVGHSRTNHDTATSSDVKVHFTFSRTGSMGTLPDIDLL